MLSLRGTRVRLIIAPDLDEEEALRLVGQAAAHALGDRDLSKALKNPLPAIDRARARRQFLALQRDFERWLKAEIADADLLYVRLPELIRQRTGPISARLRQILDVHHKAVRSRINPAMKAFYARAFELGLQAGGAGRGMLDNETRLLERVRRNEYAYLDNFITDMRYREGSMPYAQRAQLYVNALQEVFWMGYVYADLSPDRYVQWVSHGDNPCPDCAYLSGNREALAALGYDPDSPALAERMGFPPGGRWGTGVYSAQELARLGVFPQSGALACTTNCHCKLVAARRPTEKPRSGPAQGPFQSLQPKEFTGTRREGGVVVVTRAHAHEARKRYAERARRTQTKYQPRKK